MTSMDDTTQARVRWFHLTPGRFVLALLAVEVLLWLSERFGWLGWHKGYAVLTGVAVVGVAMLLMLVWFGVALIFRRRFQFSIPPAVGAGRSRGFAVQLAGGGDEEGEGAEGGGGRIKKLGLSVS